DRRPGVGFRNEGALVEIVCHLALQVAVIAAGNQELSTARICECKALNVEVEFKRLQRFARKTAGRDVYGAGVAWNKDLVGNVNLCLSRQQVQGGKERPQDRAACPTPTG